MTASHLPVRYCSDEHVQQFVAKCANDMPFDGERAPSAYQVFMEARRRYGDMACWDLLIRVH